ncbi:g10764 [Coccomyxa elongata]
MDGLDDIASMMQGFFGFDPFMGVNQNGVCGCSRVLQTRWLGIQMLSTQVRLKLENEAGTLSAEQELYAILHSCVKAIGSLADGSEESLGYEPILFSLLVNI